MDLEVSRSIREGGTTDTAPWFVACSDSSITARSPSITNSAGPACWGGEYGALDQTAYCLYVERCLGGGIMLTRGCPFWSAIACSIAMPFGTTVSTLAGVFSPVSGG